MGEPQAICMPKQEDIECAGCPLADQLIDTDTRLPLVFCQAFQEKGLIDVPRQRCWYKRQATARSTLELVHGIQPHPWGNTGELTSGNSYLDAVHNAAR